MELPWSYILPVAILLCFSAFFSGAEAALFSLSRKQLEEARGERGAGPIVSRLLANPREVLVTILLGNLLVNVLATSTVAEISLRLFGERGMGYAFLLMSFLLLIWGEILPKALALNQNEGFARLTARPLVALHTLFSPLRMPLAAIADRAVAVVRRGRGGGSRFFSRGELLTVLHLGRREGAIGQFEHELLANILEFRERTVREVMTPSVRVFSLPIDTGREDILAKVIETGYSRIPIYQGTPDNIRGILHVKDLVGASGEDWDLAALLHEPVYVPESAPVAGLFHSLVREGKHMAVVIDEYGSFVGIVTMEDVLEEVVGEIRDKHEPAGEDFQRAGEGRIVVKGGMEIRKFNEVFGTDLADEEHETIAGYLIGAIGRIPEEGETLRIGGLSFHIISARPNVIVKMRVEKV